MRTFIFGVWVAQFVVALATALAAFANLRLILFFGPALSGIGLLFAAVSLRRLSWRYMILGISAPLVCAMCAALIAVFRMGPGWDTGWPIAAILVLYDIAIAPLAIVVLYDIWHNPTVVRTRAVWRFSMKTLLLLMTAIGVLCVVMRLIVIWFALEVHKEGAVFGAYAAVCLALSTGVVWRFVVKQKKLAPDNSSGAK